VTSVWWYVTVAALAGKWPRPLGRRRLWLDDRWRVCMVEWCWVRQLLGTADDAASCWWSCSVTHERVWPSSTASLHERSRRHQEPGTVHISPEGKL